MKKVKTFIVIFIILALVVGGVYLGFKYTQGKKTAEVVSMSNRGMDGYWGDNIESNGTVTSEKSQTTYIASGTEIVSVNVKVVGSNATKVR